MIDRALKQVLVLDLSVLERVLAHVPEDLWCALPKCRETMVEMARRREGERRWASARMLVMPIASEQPSEDQCRRFGSALRDVLQQGLAVAVLQEPTLLPLARYVPMSLLPLPWVNPIPTPETHPEFFEDHGDRCLLFCYLHCLGSIQSLNEAIGHPGFVEEGEVPREW